MQQTNGIVSPQSSPLSTPPETPITDRKLQASAAEVTSTLKRKRDETEPTILPYQSKTTEASTTLRATPREVDTNKRPKKAKRQPVRRIKDQNGDTQLEPPPNWEKMYNMTQQMRSQWPAPVDTMGCESLAEDKRTPKERRFQTLIALMLSSQTKDTVTAVAMKNLQERLPGGFTLESMRKVDPPALNDMIARVGFHNNKTKYIKKVAEILVEKHDGDIPDTIAGLVSLPGVGPKMAYLCMSAAWGRDEGIGVDVHVHRITNLWGWHKTKEPEETRAMLESWLPKDKWHDINHLLVGFGQTWCPPVGRKCEECKLSQEGLCPSAVVGKSVKKQVKKKTINALDAVGDVLVREQVKVEAAEQPLKAEELDNPIMPVALGHITDIEDAVPERRRSGRLSRALRGET